MAATRSASAVWEGDLLSGKGQVSADSSKAFSELPVTWKARADSAEGKTSPEELIAAAHATCFSMALSKVLAGEGFKADRISVVATVAFNSTELKVESSKLKLEAKIPGIDQAAFLDAANHAKDGCPVSKALVGSVKIELEATLKN